MASDPKTVVVTAEVHDYLVSHGSPPDDIQRDLIGQTAALGDVSGMQIAPEQGAFMELLAKLIGAKRGIEVGTFTGYSALSLARGLGEGGHLLCCDVSEEWTAIARENWHRAGVSDRITLTIGPAAETLQALPGDPVYDIAFIDADKPGYPTYYEEILTRLRPGGVILVDNVLWSGRVADLTNNEVDTIAIRAFNDQVRDDPRVETVMLPIADGLTLLRKR